MLDHKAHQDLPEPLASPKQANLASQAPLENQVPMVSQVIKVKLVQLDQWVLKAHLVHLEYLDPLDFLLLESLDLMASLVQRDQKDSLV